MSARALPLSRRLVDRYLMFGLACVLVCIIVAVNLSYRGNFTECVSVAAIAPLFLLILGALVMRHTVRLNESIERQLREIAAVAAITPASLEPLAESEPAAIGWNTVLQHLKDQRAVSSLEARLSDSLGSADGKRWEAIFNSLGDGLAVCNKDGVVLMVNNAFSALTGLARNEKAVGEKIVELLSASFHSPPPAELAGTMSSTGNLATEWRKGEELEAGVWRVGRMPVLGNAFDANTMLWSVRDITQQKLAEDMRNQFVFTATHELRTPLANIKAYAETLAVETNLDPEQQKDFYNIINGEATRLARFVDELLNVSQMEAGAVTITCHETDVERLLGEVVECVQPQVRKKQMEFESHFPAKIPKLRLDKDKIVASLVNLLGNAVKYTPERGTVRLLVEVDESHIHFHVEDTGIGIAAEELPRICEKFFRSSDARVRKITGSGLGLAFSQEVAKLHGGKITIKSEINKGSRFTMSLPLG